MTTAFQELTRELQAAWERSDALFALLADDALLARPIALRHPFLFYVGHLPAFAWNHLGVGELGAAHIDAAFEDLFERGIDPDVGSLGGDQPSISWPEPEQVFGYRDQVRAALTEALGELARRAGHDERHPHGQVLHAVLEHELMHHETLLYMLARVEPSGRRAQGGRHQRILPQALAAAPASATRVPPDRVEVPAGRAHLGAHAGEIPFGWDNEFPVHEVTVPGFTMDALPVTHADLLEFVRAGGYQEPRHWSTADWDWKQSVDLQRPSCWVAPGETLAGARAKRAEQLAVLGVSGEQPLTSRLDRPASVSHAEASAYARWRGRRLPTEAEWQRAAHGTPDGEPRAHPWGEEPPDATRTDAGLAGWGPAPVGSHPAGASAFGIHDLLGVGWEWTSTPFAPFDGFEVTLPRYPGYSADSFDGRHFVMLGGSWATDTRLLRRSFRNWFRPHYPYVFASFRLVG